MRREPERPQRGARATLRAISAGASGDGRGTERGVARAWPVPGPARRSDTASGSVREDVARRRVAGRRRFPLRRPAPSRWPAPDRPPPASADCSRAPVLSAAWPGRPAAPRPPAARGNPLARPRRGGARPGATDSPGASTPSASRRWPMIASAGVPLACHTDSLRTGPNPRTGSGPVLGGQVRRAPLKYETASKRSVTISTRFVPPVRPSERGPPRCGCRGPASPRALGGEPAAPSQRPE